MIEIMWKDNVHYTRPDDHPDVDEARALIEEQNRLLGGSLYSIRQVGQ